VRDEHRRARVGTHRSLHGLVVAILLFAATSLAGSGLAEQAFATTAVPGSSGPALPDGRVYELVSTAGNVGEPYQPASPLGFETIGVESSEHPFEAAQDGEAVTYVGEPPALGGTGETGPGEGNQWLAVRTPTAWTTDVITPALRNVEFPAYQAFSSDLTSGIFQGGGEPLVPGISTGCRSLYSRSTASGAYSALFTNSEAPVEGESPSPCGRPLFAGASKDESEVIFQSEAALTPTAEEAVELPPGHARHGGAGGDESGAPCVFGCNLYSAAKGHLQPVNVLEGKSVPNANFGGYPGESGFPDLSNAISADGSRIFWTDTQPGPDFEHVFVLEDGENNVQVSGAEAAEYWTATPDGTIALYTEAGVLWQFNTHTNTREALTSESAAVLGVIGTNQTGEDAGYVYFVAEGVLAGNENAEHEAAIPGAPNLYLIHGGTTIFIATLSSNDNEITATSEGTLAGGDWIADMGLRTAAVTPDGRHLVFQSILPLTGYDNTLPGGPSKAVEVFIYSADEAELACGSCDPSGAPPALATETVGLMETRLPVSNESYTYLRRWMSENGNRLFFDSEQPLVAQDTNGVQDVYEWEREGEGTCASQVPARPNHGCVSLLSGGNNRGYSFLIDADATGNNVFFEHQGPLGSVQAPADRNELYDARVDGGFPEASLNCSGAGCQTGPPPPPGFSSPASIATSGGQNFPPQGPPKQPTLTRAQRLAKALKACRSKPKHKRAHCEREARGRFGPKHATHARRAQKKGSK
jgi:hypothetical protein